MMVVTTDFLSSSVYQIGKELKIILTIYDDKFLLLYYNSICLKRTIRQVTVLMLKKESSRIANIQLYRPLTLWTFRSLFHRQLHLSAAHYENADGSRIYQRLPQSPTH